MLSEKYLTELKASSLEAAKHYIENINFKKIIKKMIAEYWFEDDAVEICEQYRKFLYLIRKYGEKHGPFSPTKEIDAFWHHHILDTQSYQKDCLAIFGRYLTHDPYPQDKDKDKEETVKRFEILQKLHFEEFGYYIYEIKRNRLYYLIKTIKSFLNGTFY